MRTTSGLVLDVYDDTSGTQLRELYPNFDAIPAQVKQAHVAAGADRDRLPDDVFALVLVNNGEKLRKYACIDEGNTVLSVQYFVKNAHKLPLEAQKVGAENLKVACSWYGLKVPEALEKVALGLGTVLNTAMAVPVVVGTAGAIRGNLHANQAMGGGAAGPITPSQRSQVIAGMKSAEVSGTVLMPNQPPGVPGTAPKSDTVIKKTSSVGHLVSSSKGDTDVPPDVVHPPTKEQAPKHPQAREMRPTVDVSNQEPTKVLVEKKASTFALPGEGKYPLDSYAQVKAASAYFDQYARHMAPPTRREYAVNLVKRAEELSIPLSDFTRKYGGDRYASEAEIKAAFDARRIEVAHNEDALQLLGEVEKVARYRMWKEASAAVPVDFTPERVCELLAEFDKVAGLDHHYDRSIPDPYYSIYGFDKAASADFSEVIGNETVTEADLRRLSRIGATSVKMTFGSDFQEEFLKDPVGIFKSLPLDQKKMLMRMASSTQPGVERTYF